MFHRIDPDRDKYIDYRLSHFSVIHMFPLFLQKFGGQIDGIRQRGPILFEGHTHIDRLLNVPTQIESGEQ